MSINIIVYFNAFLKWGKALWGTATALSRNYCYITLSHRYFQCNELFVINV
jgi:hypothetical protein